MNESQAEIIFFGFARSWCQADREHIPIFPRVALGDSRSRVLVFREEEERGTAPSPVEYATNDHLFACRIGQREAICSAGFDYSGSRQGHAQCQSTVG